METFQDKVAVVTGAASGIGLAMAKAFASAGANVALADVDVDGLDAAAEQVAASGTSVLTQRCDVRLDTELEALRDRVVAEFGTAHVLCNNAGIGSGGPLEGLTRNDWEWTLGVNLWGVINGISAFLGLLKAQDEGHIVNTASVAGLFGSPFMGPYTASKFAVVGVSEVLHHELAMVGSQVGASVLCPSWVATRIHESERARPAELANPATPESDAMASGIRDMINSVVSEGMDPDDVAQLVLDAVLQRRFWILTHDTTAAVVERRTTSILSGEAPPFVMPQ